MYSDEAGDKDPVITWVIKVAEMMLSAKSLADDMETSCPLVSEIADAAKNASGVSGRDCSG
jgi:hypothetical protein